MKKTLSALLALALMASTATVAFAKGGKKQDTGYFSGVASFSSPMVRSGETVYLSVDYFYGKWTEEETEWDGKKDVTKKVTYDNEDYPIGRLYKEYYTLSANWSTGGEYIESVYFDEGDDYITIEIKGGVSSTVDKDIGGTLTLVEKGIPNRPTVTYECRIKTGGLIIEGIDEKSRMVDLGDHKFGLPDDYQEKQVRFITEDGDDYGTFVGQFSSQKSGRDVAEFQVRINSQSALYLGFSEGVNSTLAKKYPDADLRFINWSAKPVFDREGKLSIFMDSDEYIYGLNSDGSLYRLGGSYDEDNDAYVITTKTLGSYVISDIQLDAVNGSGGSGSGSGTTTTTPSSTAPAPSSSTPPAQTTQPSSTAPLPSSTAPAPTPAPAPESSSSPEDEQPSEPEDSEPEDIEPEDSDPFDIISDPDEPDDDDDDDGDQETTKKKKFPIIPVLVGVLGIVILVCAVVVVGNRDGGGKRSRRRRRYDDDWDY